MCYSLLAAEVWHCAPFGVWRLNFHQVHRVEHFLIERCFVFPFEIMPQRHVDITDAAGLHLHADVGVGADAEVDVVFS